MRVTAHPSIGMVIDSKGNVYYSDLERVWKVSNGKKSIMVANVHTHELFIDAGDNIFGEHLWYAGDASKKFYHYYWRLNQNGKLDTITSVTQAYVEDDFSLVLDKEGNQYYCKFDDSLHLFKPNVRGEEVTFAAFDFSSVKFFLPQRSGEIYFTKKNNLYRISKGGKVSLLANSIGTGKSMLWGIWQDQNLHVYVAAFGDKVIRKIGKNGKTTEFYRSPKGWAPASGVFDKADQLWILEWSDKNEVRAVLMRSVPQAKKKGVLFPLSVGVAVMLALVVSFTPRRKGKKRR